MNRHHRSLAFGLAIVLLLSGCAKKKRVPMTPMAPRTGAAIPNIGDEEVGVASWYGHPYHGRQASSGEIYDMEKLTAAHRTMPFGTIVEVRNMSNDRTVAVRINDRGPFVDGRIIDLSHAAAREIQMIGPGTAKVRLRVVGLPEKIPDGFFAVQAGAFQNRANAERLRKQMEDRYGAARLVFRDGNPPVWRVLVGREGKADDAAALAERVKKEAGPAFVVRVDGSESNL
jgi:rare lipoprotein A